MGWSTLLSGVLGSLLSRLVISLGLTFISVTGVSALLDTVFSNVKEIISGFPLAVIQLLGMCNCDLYLNIIFSAYSACVAFVTIPKIASGIFGAGH